MAQKAKTVSFSLLVNSPEYSLISERLFFKGKHPGGFQLKEVVKMNVQVNQARQRAMLQKKSVRTSQEYHIAQGKRNSQQW